MVTRPARLGHGEKHTRNHETMTVKKIGRRVPLKLFFYVHWILRKKQKPFIPRECRIWFNVAEKWRLSSLFLQSCTDCLLQHKCECFVFSAKNWRRKKGWKQDLLLKFAFLNKKLSILQAIICQILLSASTARGKVQTRCSVLRSWQKSNYYSGLLFSYCPLNNLLILNKEILLSPGALRVPTFILHLNLNNWLMNQTSEYQKKLISLKNVWLRLHQIYKSPQKQQRQGHQD